MKISITSLLLTSLLLAGSNSALSTAGTVALTSVSEAVSLHDWVAKKGANLCGISKLKRVTNPAVVDYEALLSATPQIKELRERGINPNSLEGKTLRESARSLIVVKAQAVRRGGGYCGLWKAIHNKDGRVIDDVTADVIALL